MQDDFFSKTLNLKDRKRECRVIYFYFFLNGKRALDRSRTCSSLIDGSKGYFQPKKQFIGGKNSREDTI